MNNVVFIFVYKQIKSIFLIRLKYISLFILIIFDNLNDNVIKNKICKIDLILNFKGLFIKEIKYEDITYIPLKKTINIIIIIIMIKKN